MPCSKRYLTFASVWNPESAATAVFFRTSPRSPIALNVSRVASSIGTRSLCLPRLARAIGLAVSPHEMMHCTLHLLHLPAEVLPRAAPGLARIRRHLHSVDREH